MTEFLVIDYAMEEVRDGRLVWEYFDGELWEEHDDMEESGSDLSGSRMDEALTEEMDKLDVSLEEGEDTDSEEEEPNSEEGDDSNSAAVGSETHASLLIRTGGTRLHVFEDEERDGKPSFEVLGRSKFIDKTKLDYEALHFLNELQNLMRERVEDAYLPVLTEHRRGETVFRGHPNYRGGGPWKDWALVDWGGGWGVLPSHIWCFVQVGGMPTGSSAPVYGGIRLHDGVYAVVEVATYDEEDEVHGDYASDLFTPLTLEVEALNPVGDEVVERKFYLANTDAIVGPCVVIPDIPEPGGPPNAYLQVKPRAEWSKHFVTWLRSRHGDDVIEQQVEAK